MTQLRRTRFVFAASAIVAITLPAQSMPSVAAAAPSPLSWLSTGDSYSAGEGVRGNIGACAQSDQAWGPFAANMLRGEPYNWDIATTVFSACTGHLVQDFYNARPDTEDPASLWEWALKQPGAPASHRFDVITLSFGGNDIGFADVIMDCLAAPIHKYDSLDEVLDRGAWFGPVLAKDIVSTSAADIVPFFGDDCDAQEGELRRRVDMLFDPSPCGAAAWRGGRTEFSNYDCELVIDDARGVTGSMVDFWLHVVANSLTDSGVLVVQGYPALFADSESWGLGQAFRCNGVTRGDANMLGRVADYFDQRLRDGVDTANRILGSQRIVYSSVADLYESGGHSLCGNGDDWLNGSITLTRDEPFLVPMPVDGILTVNPSFRFRHLGAFHPTANGHEAEARQVVDLLASHPMSTTPPPRVDRSAFEGSWSGDIQGAGGAFEAVIALSLTGSALGGTIEHPDLPCRGELTELVATDVAVTFSPSFTPESNCIHNGTTRLTLLNPDRMLYEWFHPTSDRVDTGELRRVVAEPPTPAAEPLVLTASPGARSRYSDTYFADVIDVEHLGGYEVRLTFEARGASDLRRPESSCLVNSDGSIAVPIDTELEIDEPGRYRGTLTFPLIVEGPWSLRYSCRTDYSDAPIGEVQLASTGRSIFSANYYATVFSVTNDAAGNFLVTFASHGYTSRLGDLRDPVSSCLVVDGNEFRATSASYSAVVPGVYYAGTLAFSAGSSASGSLQFLYSCKADYSVLRVA